MSTNLFSSLHVGKTALAAHSYGLGVVGSNLANIGTPGHVKRSPVLHSERLELGGGVRHDGLVASRNEHLERSYRKEISAASEAQSKADALSTIDGYLGDGSAEPLSGLLQGVHDALSAATVDGLNPTRRRVIISELESFALGMRQTAQFVERERSTLDRSLSARVGDVNVLTKEISLLNSNLRTETDNDAKQPLIDNLTARLAQLSELVEVTSTVRKEGDVDVRLRSGQSLVLGSQSFDLRATVNLTNDALHDVYVTPPGATPTDVTASLGGSLGGMIDARDGTLKNVQDRLDEIAVAFADDMDAAHAAGFDLNGAAGGPMFEARGTSGQALNLTVSAGLKADPSSLALADSPDPQDLGNIPNLLGSRDRLVLDGGVTSVREGLDGLAALVGSDVNLAQRNADLRSGLRDEAQMLRDRRLETTVEESAIELMRYQRGIQAATSYIRIVDEMLDNLLSIK